MVWINCFKLVFLFFLFLGVVVCVFGICSRFYLRINFVIMYCCLCSVYYLSKFDAKLDTITILKFINDDHAEILVLDYKLWEKTKTMYIVEQKLKIIKCMWVLHQVSIISESLYMKTVCRLTKPLIDEVFYKTIVGRVRIMI